MPIEAFTAISHNALAAALSPEQKEAGARLPLRLKVLDWGGNPSVKGMILVDDRSALGFSAKQKATGKDRVAIDFQHNSLPGTDAYKESPEPRKVAGYGTPVMLAGDGIYLDEIVWTPEGIAHALNYEDLSPAPYLDDDRRVTGLHSVGLVRNGAIEGLHFFSADESAQPNPTEKSMNDEQMAAFTQLQETVATLASSLQAISEKIEGMSAKPEANAAEESKVIALSTSVGALAGTVEAMQRDQLISEATRDGKVIPLSADDLADFPLPKLKSMIANLKSVVPLSSESRERKVPESQHVDSDLAKVAAVTGFSVDQLKTGELNPTQKEAK